MKKIFLILLLIPLLIACNDDEKEKNNIECSITSPSDGAEHNIYFDLIIRGTATSRQGTISTVNLTFDGKKIAGVTSVPFEYTIKAANLEEGTFVIKLSVEDDLGQVAEESVTFKVVEGEDPRKLRVDTDELKLTYWTEEAEFTIMTDGEWDISIPVRSWLLIWDEEQEEWAEGIRKLNGTGGTTIKVKSPANAQFEAKNVVWNISGSGEDLEFPITQLASPDMMMMLEDEMLRMAASISIVLYDVDTGDGMGGEPDGKISAAEAEHDPGIFGFDAGGWDVASVKGIEYFPQLKHLDINRGKVTEVDLSGNPNLMSLHVQFNPNLKQIDLTPVERLIEIGCDFELYQNLNLEPLRDQMHTIAVLNRESHHPTTLDFSNFPELQRLFVYDNGLTEINILGSPKLYLFSAADNLFTELDISEMDQDEPMISISGNPKLEKVYVWKGFDPEFCGLWSVDAHVEIIEK